MPEVIHDGTISHQYKQRIGQRDFLVCGTISLADALMAASVM